MLNNYICALDIGSSKIAACVARIKKKRVESLFFESMPSKGVREGAIVDSIELVNCLSKLMKNLKAKSGINIKVLYANISGHDIVTKHSRAIVPLAERGNKVITIPDIERVNEEARILGSSLEEEIIHMTPSSYTIDSKSSVVNPLGLYSHRLEVDLYLTCGKLSSIQSLSRAVNQSGYEIKRLFFSGLGTSKAIFTREFNEGINLFCDIGSDITEILVFKDGVLSDIEILLLGSNNLTTQIQDALEIPFDLAEDIKRSYGAVGDPAGLDEDKEILVKKSNLYKPIKQKLVSEIITSGVKSICAKIKDCVDKKVANYEVSNFVVVGRTVLLEGFIETLENTLSIPVKLGRISNPQILSLVKEDSALSGQKYLMYLTALGMLCEAIEGRPPAASFASQPPKNIILRSINRFKELYQEYF